jgi:hypothetical protein
VDIGHRGIAVDVGFSQTLRADMHIMLKKKLNTQPWMSSQGKIGMAFLNAPTLHPYDRSPLATGKWLTFYMFCNKSHASSATYAELSSPNEYQ